jgi:hypothetical protein
MKRNSEFVRFANNANRATATRPAFGAGLPSILYIGPVMA